MKKTKRLAKTVVLVVLLASVLLVWGSFVHNLGRPGTLRQAYPALANVQQIHSILITNSFSGWGITALVSVSLQSDGTQFTGVANKQTSTEASASSIQRESTKLTLSRQSVERFLKTLGDITINSHFENQRGELLRLDGSSRLEIVLKATNSDKLKISCRDSNIRLVCYYPDFTEDGRWVAEVSGNRYPFGSNKPYAAFLLITPFSTP